MFDKRLPKDPQYTKVKTSKTTQLRLSNKTAELNSKKALKQKAANIQENERDKSADQNKRAKNDTEKESDDSPVVGSKKSNEKHSNVDEDLLPERVGTFTKQSQESNSTEEVENIQSVIEGSSENPKDGIISKKQLHELYNKLQKMKDKEDCAIEPESVPGGYFMSKN